MPDIQFEEEQELRRSGAAPKSTPRLVSLVMRLGLARNEQGANAVLLIIAVVAIILAIWIF